MCGLVAMHTIEKQGFLGCDKDEFKQMLILNSLRGSHSTGVAGIDMQTENAEVNLIRGIGSPYQLFGYGASEEFFLRMVSDFTTVIGHGRYATKGAINADNAHPFKEGHITLAHNGVINNYFNLKDWTKHKHIEVDSHLIAALIAEEGAQEVLPQVEGAYVFIWHDALENTFNIARNSLRPLFVAEQKGNKTLTFASEEQTLVWNGSRNKTPYSSIAEIPDFQIFKFHADSLEPEVTPYRQRTHKIHSYGNGVGYHNNWEDNEVFHQDTGNYKEGKRKHRRNASDNDMTMLNSILDNSQLRLEMKVSFILDDYKEEHQYTMVTGFNEMYPNVLFRATFSPNDKITVDKLLEADFVEGHIKSMNSLHNNPDGYVWQCFIGNASIHKDEIVDIIPNDAPDEDDEVRCDVRDVMGFTRSITRYRLKELAKGGCSWCQHPIPATDLLNPENCIIYDIDRNTEELVCSECSKDTIKTFNPH